MKGALKGRVVSSREWLDRDNLKLHNRINRGAQHRIPGP